MRLRGLIVFGSLSWRNGATNNARVPERLTRADTLRACSASDNYGLVDYKSKH